MGKNPKQEAARTLFNIMFDELAEFNLSNYELSILYGTLVAMSVLSYEQGAQEKKGILHFIDSASDNCTMQEIENACNCLDMDKYTLRYYAHLFGQKSHLYHILRSYTEKYELPKNKQDIMDFIRGSDFDRDRYDDFVTERIKDSEGESIQWYLKTLHGKTILVPNAVFIWPESEGFFRFIDKNGKWGFVDSYTLKITMLPNNVVEMNDFKKCRARVLVGNMPITSIKNGYRLDFECGETDNLYWNYIDMRGVFINEKHYSSAEDFDVSTAKVKMSQDGAYWGFMEFEKGIPCPYDNMEIDLLGNFTDECEKRLKESLSEVEKRKQEAKKKIAERRFFREINSGSDDEDNIMGALGHGCGDIYGF